MRIFLGLRDTSLRHTVCREPFPKGIRHADFRECDLFIWNRRIVIGKAYKSRIQSFSSLKSFKIIIAETSGDLSCTVRSEIEKYDGVLVLYCRNRRSALYDNRRFHKFIGVSLVIRLLDSLRSARCRLALSLRQSVIC